MRCSIMRPFPPSDSSTTHPGKCYDQCYDAHASNRNGAERTDVGIGCWVPEGTCSNRVNGQLAIALNNDLPATVRAPSVGAAQSLLSYNASGAGTGIPQRETVTRKTSPGSRRTSRLCCSCVAEASRGGAGPRNAAQSASVHTISSGSLATGAKKEVVPIA